MFLMSFWCVILTLFYFECNHGVNQNYCILLSLANAYSSIAAQGRVCIAANERNENC